MPVCVCMCVCARHAIVNESLLSSDSIKDHMLARFSRFVISFVGGPRLSPLTPTLSPDGSTRSTRKLHTMTSSALCDVRLRPANHGTTLATTRGGDAEFVKLTKALKAAFSATTEISRHHPAGNALQSINPTRLAAELRGHEQWNEGCYTRTTLLHEDAFVVMLLCWSPGVSSPVHAHSDAETGIKSNCFLRVLDGGLEETFYEPTSIIGDTMSVSALDGRVSRLSTGEQSYINDGMGLHKVANVSATQRAVSLHVYAPGWKVVHTYDEMALSTAEDEVAVDASGAPIDVDGWGDF